MTRDRDRDGQAVRAATQRAAAENAAVEAREGLPTVGSAASVSAPGAGAGGSGGGSGGGGGGQGMLQAAGDAAPPAAPAAAAAAPDASVAPGYVPPGPRRKARTKADLQLLELREETEVRPSPPPASEPCPPHLCFHVTFLHGSSGVLGRGGAGAEPGQVPRRGRSHQQRLQHARLLPPLRDEAEAGRGGMGHGAWRVSRLGEGVLERVCSCDIISNETQSGSRPCESRWQTGTESEVGLMIAVEKIALWVFRVGLLRHFGCGSSIIIGCLMDGLRIVSSASLRLTGDIAAFTAEVVDSADELNADSCSSETYTSLPSAAAFGYSAFIRRFYDDDVARTQCPAYYFTIGDSWKRVALTSGVVIVSPTREEVRRHRAAYVAADDPSSFDKTITLELLGSQGVRPTLILHFEAATAYFRWHRLLRFALGTVLLSEACQDRSGPRSSDSSSGEVDVARLDAALARCVSAGLVCDDHPLLQRARALRAFKARLTALAASLSAASDATTAPTAAVLREVKVVLRRLLDRRADPVWTADPAAVAVMRLGARALPPADLQDLLASTSTPSSSSPASSSSPLSSSPSVAVVGQGAEVVADPFSSPQVAASVCGGGGRAQTHRHAHAPASSPLAHGAKVRLGPLVEAVAQSPTAAVARGGAKGGGSSGGVLRTPLADITPHAAGSTAGPEAGRARLTPPARAGRYFPGTFLAPPRPPASHASDAVGGSGGSGGAGSAGACLWDDVDALLSPQPPSPAAAAATACALSRALSLVAAARAADARIDSGRDCDSCSDGDGGDKENGGARRSYVSSSSSSSAPSSGSSTPLGWGWESVGSDDDEPKIAPGDSGEDSDGSGSLALSTSTSTSTSTSVDTAPFRSPTKRAPARTSSTGGSTGRRGGRRRAVVFRSPLSSPGPPPAAPPPPRTHLCPPAPAPRGVLKFAPPLPAASATPFARGPQAPLPGWASPASPPGGPGGEEGLDALDVGAGLAATAEEGGGEGGGDEPGRALFTAASPAAPAPWQGPQQQQWRRGGGDFCHASPWASPSLTPSHELGDDFRHDPEVRLSIRALSFTCAACPSEPVFSTDGKCG